MAETQEAPKAQGATLMGDYTELPGGDKEPNRTVASPTGPIPVAAVTRDSDEAEELLAERGEAVAREGRRSALDVKLSDKEIDSLDGPTVRAIAASRGYRDFPEAGARSAREELKRRQAEDPRFAKAKK